MGSMVSQLKGGNFLHDSNKSKTTFNCMLSLPFGRIAILPLTLQWNAVVSSIVHNFRH